MHRRSPFTHGLADAVRSGVRRVYVGASPGSDSIRAFVNQESGWRDVGERSGSARETLPDGTTPSRTRASSV